MIDIGVNLLSGQFDADREQVVQRALDAGVRAMIMTATDLAESEQALQYCASGAALFCTTGIHPHNATSTLARDTDHALARMEALADHPKVVAIGETGLDYFRDFADPADQRVVCAAQLQLAARLQMPVFAHDRDASDDLTALIDGSGVDPARMVIHCFTGTEPALQRYLDMGCMIGITGWLCDAKRGAALRALVPNIPLDRLLIETDAPYLRPQNAPPDALPKTGSRQRRRNEPALLPFIAKAVAELMGIDAAQVVDYTRANSQRLFPRLTLKPRP